MIVLIDTNILISAALNPNDTPFKAYVKAVSYPNQAIICEQNIDELRRIFNRKFSNKLNVLEEFLALSLPVLKIVSTPEAINESEDNNSSGYKADYTLDSMKEVDRFFDEQDTPGGILSKKQGTILFALASYIGETVIKLYEGRWVIDEDDPDNEINMAVQTSSGKVLWPAKRCMKRYTNGV